MNAESPKPTAQQRAIDFAKNTLAVDAVFDEARAALDELEDRQETLAKTSARRRNIEAEIADREIELIAEHRAANAEMSQAAFDRHMKVVLQQDDQLLDLRTTREAHVSEHERAEYDAERAKLQVRLLSARMEELGGLLHFYAAVKIASSSDTTTQ